MTNVSIPVEFVTVLLLLAQSVQWLVMRRKSGVSSSEKTLTEQNVEILDHQKIIINQAKIIEGQKEIVSVLTTMDKNGWRTAELLKDIKDDLKEFMRTAQK